MTGKPKPPKRGKGPIPSKTRALLRQRSSGRCEACHRLPATDAHHRRYKTRGGSHSIENLLHLCGGESGLPGGNSGGCHGIAHSQLGEERGLSTPSWEAEGGDFLDNHGHAWTVTADGQKYRAADGGRDETTEPREEEA